MFRFRKSIDGDAIIPVKDYPLNAAYAAVAKEGDVVKIVGGEIVAAATGDTTVAGILEGMNFNGLRVDQTPKIGKVQTSTNAVYEADHVGGNPAIGTAYGIDGSSNLDVADTAVPVFKVVDIVNGKPYVRLIAPQL